MGTRAPGNRSLSEPSALIVKTSPSSLKIARRSVVCRMQVIFVLGLPIRIGPDQEPAIFGSLVHLRIVLAAASAAHSSSPTVSRKLAEKPAGSAHVVQPPGARSSSVPSSQATYSASTDPA